MSLSFLGLISSVSGTAIKNGVMIGMITLKIKQQE
jgi:hypothetical protein